MHVYLFPFKIIKFFERKIVGVVALGVDSSLQDSCKFIDLRTRKLIVRRWLTVISMPQKVIERVIKIRTSQKEKKS